MRYSVVDDVGTVINPLLLKGQIVGGVAQGVGQILMEDIHFDADGQLVTGSFMDYAMPRADNFSADRGQEPIRCRPRPTRSASRAPARPAASAPCRRSPTRIVDALSQSRRAAHRDAGDAGARVAHHPTSQRRLTVCRKEICR